MGDILTAAKILGRTKLNALTDVRNLNLWGNDYSDISILRQLPNVEVLSLSVNSITTLKDLSNCLQLRELYLRKNRISELSEILYLVNLTHLKILWLSENPCCQTSNYREYVLSKLPNLQKLDNTDITKEEREIAMKRSSSAGSGGGGVGGNGGGMVQLRPASISDSDFASPRFSSPKGGEGGVQQFDFRSSNASLSPVSSPSRRAQSAHGYSRDDASRVPPLDFRQARSPVRKLDSQLALEGETPAELAARRRTDALEEEIRILRLAEDAERIRESARARMVASPVGRRQSTNRSTHSSPNSPRIRSAYGSPRHGAPVATPVVLSPRSSELSSAYVNGSQSSRIHPESNTVTQANTSNHVYGGPASAAASRPATARPAAGEKPNHIPPFARQLIPNNTNQQNGTPQRMSRPSSAAPSSFSPRVSSPPPASSAAAPLSPRSSGAQPPVGIVGWSSGVALTPRNSYGRPAPPATQHNLMCAALAMIEEFDLQHLQWLQKATQAKIDAATRNA